ncbi:MAG TPA: zf-HC2 domain-containing protein [Gemmatimonadaceae bacterium]|jgi:anti-sigma factor RsiW|nr:zf-HC2 domain-containing protein [Gemmatimonadaceae bacterium]
MSECNNGELRDLLPELVNGRLDAQMQRTVEAHVATCAECAEELELLRSLRPALMRGPTVDARKIAAAVHAQAASQPGRDAARSRFATPLRIAIAAAALLAVSVVGYAVVRRGSGAEEMAVVHNPDFITAPAFTPAPIVAPPRSAPVQTPPQQIAVTPPHVAAPASAPAVAASVGVLDNLSDLSDDDVRTLTASLDGMSSVPDADPSAGIDPLGASLDDNSAGGT